MPRCRKPLLDVTLVLLACWPVDGHSIYRHDAENHGDCRMVDSSSSRSSSSSSSSRWWWWWWLLGCDIKVLPGPHPCENPVGSQKSEHLHAKQPDFCAKQADCQTWFLLPGHEKCFTLHPHGTEMDQTLDFVFMYSLQDSSAICAAFAVIRCQIALNSMTGDQAQNRHIRPTSNPK